jgi:molybdate transport system ATP-binding protein
VSVVLREVTLPLAEFCLEADIAMEARTTAVYGPSGAGKTSLLELIAGLRTPESGTILLNGEDVTRLPPRARRVGYVPQDDALFPHLSVRRNIVYGGPLNDDVVNVLEIAPLLERGVKQLSGGERKRVALARALLRKPVVLLLDEPLAGVDVALRGRVLEYLRRVRDELRVPMLYVTHQREEGEALCEEVVVVERGKLAPPRRIA